MLKNGRQFGRWVKSKERAAEPVATVSDDVVAHDAIATSPVLEVATKRSAPKSKKKTTKRKASKS